MPYEVESGNNIPLYQKGAPNGVATLDASGLVPTSQLPFTAGLAYQGVWDADTNTPTIVSGVGTDGYYYVVSVAGTTLIDGNSDWHVGDWIIFNGTAWDKLDNSGSPRVLNVNSVNAATYTLALDDDIVHVVYTSTGPCTVTIPSAIIAVAGRRFEVNDAAGNAGTNNITIVTEGSELINGDSGGALIDMDEGVFSFYTFGGNVFIGPSR